MSTHRLHRAHALLAIGLFGIAGLVAHGASQIKDDAGYTGVNAAFLPWLVALALAVCAAGLMQQALRGGFKSYADPTEGEAPRWLPMAWVSAGLLLNAALITRVGFVCSCALLFTLAAHGFRLASPSTPTGWPATLHDLALGFALSAPTYWIFTKALGLNLPGLTGNGWI